MALPKPPPPIDVTPEGRRLILAAFKKIVEVFQANGLLDSALSHSDILHDPGLLQNFDAVFSANPTLYADIVVDATGRPVTQPDRLLTCGLTLGQVQQLAVRTCARFAFLGEEEEKLVTRTVTTTKFLVFKETQRITERVRNKDPRLLKEILSYIAFDWQLPLLADYADLSLPQLAELSGNILALRTPEAVREVQRFDPAALRKAKALLGPEFSAVLEARPGAIGGLLYWPREMHQFFRSVVGRKFYDFMARDEKFFMFVGAMEKTMQTLYGDVLGYIAQENLVEIRRLNLDRTEILLATMKATFGPRIEQLLALPNFAREVLRRQVEGLLHVRGDKKQMTEVHAITWDAAAPQVLEWLAKQKGIA